MKKDGGWHFSYINDAQGVENKLKSYRHHIEYDLYGIGVEKIEEFQLNELEKREFEKSINAVKELWKAACKIDGDLIK